MGLNKIKELKKEKKMTTQRLSELSGIPAGTINKILSGATKDPKLETLKALASALGCTVDDFIDGNDPDVTEAQEKTSYYLSPDVTKMAQDIYDNPELRIMFDASQKLTREDILAVVDIMKRMKGQND